MDTPTDHTSQNYQAGYQDGALAALTSMARKIQAAIDRLSGNDTSEPTS